jgi:hypothetical protein
MSAFHDSALIGASGSQGSYQISRSVRLRRSASGYFNRTPASTGNRKTWTWSGWVKRGEFSATAGIQVLFDSRSGASDNTIFGLSFGDGTYGTSADGLFVGQYNYFALVTTQVFRDPSAWYHIVLALDTTQSTAANRMKLYVNGLQITTFNSTTYPVLNADLAINLNQLHTLGSQSGSSNFTNGYLTDVNFIDGQGLTPSSFGEFNAITGVWQPKKYAGTYGTNGFYLNFSDNSASTATTIGADYSGNGNNWTPNNISVTAGVTYDSMIDTPTPYADGGNGRGNYAVMNPLNAAPTATPSDGNLLAAHTSGSTASRVGSTLAVNAGKWYWEATVVAKNNSTYPNIGIAPATSVFSNTGSVDLSGTSGAKCIRGDGTDQAGTAYGGALTAGMVVGFALDMDAGTIVVYENNVSQGTLASGLSGYYIVGSGSYNNSNVQFNFGQRPFSYTPPTGFLALNTQNLPASTIDNGAAYMAATLYTGNNTGQTIVNTVNGVSFQPNLIWVKIRSTTGQHVLTDSVRGVSTQLFSSLTNAETTEVGKGITAFNSNGFTLGAELSVTGSTNANAGTYVGWQWKAGGAAVTNTAGSISSQVSANVSAGFSVVTYTGTGANATVGHGLGAAPKFIIVKSRSAAGSNWPCYHVATGNLGYNYLNLTLAVINNAGYWNSTTPTSTVFSLGNDGANNASAATFVAYCFAEVAGYSKFGSYTGNGSTDGTFVYLGFRPRFVMVKRTDSTSDWVIWDTSRETYNVEQAGLYPNLSVAEGNSYFIDILSNGFKLRMSTITNVNGGTYIYACFAENPFSKSLAR